MTGSLQLKNGKYYAVINTYDCNGKRKQKWIATDYEVKGNKKRAEQFLRDTLKDFELNEHLVPTDIIFSDYIRYWLKIATIRIDIVTIQGYEAAANAHILPYFDNLKVKLKDINHFILQEYFNVKYQSGKKDGQAVYLQRL